MICSTSNIVMAGGFRLVLHYGLAVTLSDEHIVFAGQSDSRDN
jgi:hypothetical protein